MDYHICGILKSLVFVTGRKSEHVYPRMSFPFVTCSKRMTNMSKKWCSSVVSHLWGPRRMKLSVFFLTPKLCHGRNAGWRKKWSPKVRSKSCELFHLLKWTSAKFARITSKVWSFGAPLPCVKLFFTIISICEDCRLSRKESSRKEICPPSLIIWYSLNLTSVISYISNWNVFKLSCSSSDA